MIKRLFYIIILVFCCNIQLTAKEKLVKCGGTFPYYYSENISLAEAKDPQEEAAYKRIQQSMSFLDALRNRHADHLNLIDVLEQAADLDGDKLSGKLTIDALSNINIQEAMENAWIDPMVKIVLDDVEDTTVPINEDYFMDLCIVLSEIMKAELLLTDEEMDMQI